MKFTAVLIEAYGLSPEEAKEAIQKALEEKEVRATVVQAQEFDERLGGVTLYQP